jgi:galactose-1-phosphate uridylyltransferase
MNERLLDICIKAGINTWPFNEVGFISLDESELVKFAELIVRECVGVSDDYVRGCLCEEHKNIKRPRSTIGRKIREHFGVEE